MVMSMSSTPSAKMLKNFCPAEVCVFKFFQVCSYVCIQKYNSSIKVKPLITVFTIVLV